MLAGIDQTSATWRALQRWALAEVEIARRTNEVKGLDVVDTEFTRGRIHALRQVLKLTDTKPGAEPGSDTAAEY